LVHISMLDKIVLEKKTKLESYKWMGKQQWNMYNDAKSNI
jgi:hypothetical protein